MAIATTTTWGSAIREVYTPGKLVDAVFKNQSLFDFSSYPLSAADPAAVGYGTVKGLFPVVQSKGGNSWNWNVAIASGAAEAYVEGQGAPAPGNTTMLMAELAYSGGYFQRTIELTGHLLDQCRDEAEILNAFDVEYTKAVESIIDGINTTMLGASWLRLAVDSAGIYAGINRSTYAAWGAWENALNGALSRSALDDMVEAVTDNDRGASEKDLLFLGPRNQLTNHGALAGVASTTATIPINAAGGGNLDMGFATHSHAGIPMIGLPDAEDTEVLLIHRPSFYGVMHRAPQIEAKPTAGDTYQWLLTCCLILVCERPFLCAKQTGVTA